MKTIQVLETEETIDKIRQMGYDIEIESKENKFTVDINSGKSVLAKTFHGGLLECIKEFESKYGKIEVKMWYDVQKSILRVPYTKEI